MVIDHTYKPANWYTYAPMADITAIDPYPFVKTQTIRDGNNFMEAIGDVVHIARCAAQPRPLFVTMGLHHFKEGRMPTERELRSQLYWALAEGAKGVNYYSWTFKQGKGLSDYPDLHSEIRSLNSLCNDLGDWLVHSQPVSGVLNCSEQVDARTLVGKDGQVLLFVIARDAQNNINHAKVDIQRPEIKIDRITVVDGSEDVKYELDSKKIKLSITASRPCVIIRIY